MENCLQITDHWVTIVAGIFTIFLTLITTWIASKTYYLTIKDKQKTIAINELKLHTEKLENLLLLQIQPKFTIRLKSTDYMDIVNIGGDCYKLKISTIGGFGNYGNPFEEWDDFFSTSTAKSINYSTFGDRNFIFTFEDKLGNKMKQILYTSKRKFSNLEIVND